VCALLKNGEAPDSTEPTILALVRRRNAAEGAPRSYAKGELVPVRVGPDGGMTALDDGRRLAGIDPSITDESGIVTAWTPTPEQVEDLCGPGFADTTDLRAALAREELQALGVDTRHHATGDLVAFYDRTIAPREAEAMERSQRARAIRVEHEAREAAQVRECERVPVRPPESESMPGGFNCRCIPPADDWDARAASAVPGWRWTETTTTGQAKWMLMRNDGAPCMWVTLDGREHGSRRTPAGIALVRERNADQLRAAVRPPGVGPMRVDESAVARMSDSTVLRILEGLDPDGTQGARFDGRMAEIVGAFGDKAGS
jgi:hypothetical protein